MPDVDHPVATTIERGHVPGLGQPDHAVRRYGEEGDGERPADSPILTASRLAAGCQVFMALGMIYMLVA